MKRMEKTYDIAVLGAGPAGLQAAGTALESGDGVSVILLDQRKPWEAPIACAEGVFENEFRAVISPDEKWIRFVVGHAAYHSPDGTVIEYTSLDNRGCIIDRAEMQRDLANRCENLGAQVKFGERVEAVGEPDGAGVRTVYLRGGTGIRAKVVIDGSGPLSRFGKEEGINWKPTDLEPAFFAVIENVSVRTDRIEIFLGNEIAPGGYGWSFPRSPTCANVGVTISSRVKGANNIRRLLSQIIQRHYPHGTVTARFAGAIPCGVGKQRIAAPGFLKAGDAASTVNPISRAGITEAMLSGNLAGRYAVEMLGAQTRRALGKIAREYEKTWHEKLGRKHAKLAKVKSSLLKIPDRDYNAGAQALTDIPRDRLTMSKMFTVSLGRFPRLVWALRHLM